jgi:predicted phage terminase large subunit-like protein
MPTKRLSQIKLPKKAVSPEQFREMAQEFTEAVQQERAAAQVAAESLAAGRAAFTEADGTREERLERTRWDDLQFGLTYLPHYFENEPADFHPALSKVTSGRFTDQDIRGWQKLGIEVHRGNPLLRLTAIQVARGFAKSTIVNLCGSLRRICHGHDPYLIIGGDTFGQAGAQLEDIKDELATNEKIRADFGNLKPKKGLWREVEMFQKADGHVTWREGQIITTNKVRVDAIGRGGKMRGRRFGAQRPTCFTADDLDNDENVVTKEQRDKAWNWVISAVVPAMDPKRGEIRIIGTTVHFDCVVARAERKTDGQNRRMFTSIKFPAMRRGKKEDDWVSNWPARFSVEQLLAIRDLLGPSKFGAEYMNNPRDPETQLYDWGRFTFYSAAELQGKELRRILYVDPSKGKKGKGRKKSDFSSFVDDLYAASDRISYINDAYRKRLTPTAARAHVIEWYLEARKGPYLVELWVEENAFGDIMAEGWQDELRRRGVDIPVNTLLHTTEKNARLERHSTRVETGGVRFPERWEREDRRPEWAPEYEDFPAGAFDDVIDGIESADHVGTELSAGKPDFASSGQKQGFAMLKGF